MFAGFKTALKIHEDYMQDAEAREDFLHKLGNSHEWSSRPGSPATDYRDQFLRNCRLFKFFPVFHVHADGDDQRGALMSGRFRVSLGTFMPLHGRRSGSARRTIWHKLSGLFGDTFNMPVTLRTKLQLCAKMQSWAGGGALKYPPLPVIEGIGKVDYHAACNFIDRPVKLWPPSDLRRFLQARHYKVPTPV